MEQNIYNFHNLSFYKAIIILRNILWILIIFTCYNLKAQEPLKENKNGKKKLSKSERYEAKMKIQADATRLQHSEELDGKVTLTIPFYKKKIGGKSWVKDGYKDCEIFLHYFDSKLLLIDNNEKGGEDKRNKEKHTHKIIAFEKSKINTTRILKPESAYSSYIWYAKYFTYPEYPHNIKLYEQAIEISGRKDLIKLIPIAPTNALKEEAYQRYFTIFLTIEKVHESIKVVTVQQNDRVKTIAAKIAATRIKNQDDFALYFEYFGGLADEYAIKQLSNLIPCEEIKNFILDGKYISAYLQTQKFSLIEEISAYCIKNLEDFESFYGEFGNGQYLDTALKSAISFASKNCGIFSFMKKYPHLASEYQSFFEIPALNCIKTLDDCKYYSQVYNKRKDIENVLNRALVLFDKDDLLDLLESPIYQKHKNVLASVFCQSVQTLDDFHTFYKNFGTDVNCFETALQKALDLASKDCGIYGFLESYPQLLNSKHKDAIANTLLACTKTLDDFKKIIKLFNEESELKTILNHAVVVFDNINDLTPIVKLPIFAKHKSLVEEVFYQAIRNTSDIDIFWYLYCPDSENNCKGALAKGIEFVKGDEHKLKEIILKFRTNYENFDGLLAHITCDIAFAFVSEYIEYKEELSIRCLECIGDDFDLFDKYLRIYGDENLGIVLNSIIPHLNTTRLVEIYRKYNDSDNIIENAYYKKIIGLNHVDEYLDVFTDGSHRSHVLEKGIKMSKASSRLFNYMNKYLIELPYNEDVIEYLGCNQVFDFVSKYRQHKKKLEARCLHCVRNQRTANLFGDIYPEKKHEIGRYLVENTLRNIEKSVDKKIMESKPSLSPNESQRFAFNVKEHSMTALILDYEEDIKIDMEDELCNRIKECDEINIHKSFSGKHLVFLEKNEIPGDSLIINLENNSKGIKNINMFIVNLPNGLDKKQLEKHFSSKKDLSKLQHIRKCFDEDELSVNDMKKILGRDLYNKLIEGGVQEGEVDNMAHKVYQQYEQIIRRII